VNARIAAGLALLATAVLLGFPATAEGLAGFDVPLFRLLALTPASPSVLVATAQFVSHFGDPSLRTLFVIAVGALFVARHCWRSAGAYLLIVLVSILSHTQAKIFFARARPHLTPWFDYAGDMSYPSGHAAGSMVVLLAAALLIRERRLHWAAVALSLAIGLTRPMLGMHWPSDVIGGWMWGAGFALVGTGVAMKLGLPRVRVVGEAA
jgi:undecaprenyl-diphosphatase